MAKAKKGKGPSAGEKYRGGYDRIFGKARKTGIAGAADRKTERGRSDRS